MSIRYRSHVELAAHPDTLLLPFGVGGLKRIQDGIRGVVGSTGYGLNVYVRWADGSEGPCPVRWLKEIN